MKKNLTNLDNINPESSRNVNLDLVLNVFKICFNSYVAI